MSPLIKRPFETWRKMMIAGAVLLLAGSVMDALRGGAPDDSLLRTLANGVAFGLLFAGFGLAMRRRMENQKERDAAASADADSTDPDPTGDVAPAVEGGAPESSETGRA
jgi:hypothetical protein